MVAPSRRTPSHARPRRQAANKTRLTALRIVIAVGCGAGLTLLLWLNIGTHLTVTTDIVGRTTFADFDVYRYLERFYDIALVLPASAAIVYVVLQFFGPLRADPPHRPWPPHLDTADVGEAVDVRVRSRTEDESLATSQVIWALVRVGIVALTVGIESNIARSPHESVVTGFGVDIALLYVVVVAFGTLVLGLQRRRSFPRESAGEGNGSGRWISHALSMDLVVVNAFASLAVIPLLVLVSLSTTVTVASNGRVTHYPWFPAWLGITATVIAAVLLVRALRRAGGDSMLRRSVERRSLLILVVPTFLFVITASLQPAQSTFYAFDDAQAMVGAKLSFWHGLWPWRDLFLLHGFLSDALYGAVGMWVLSPTRWGSNSGTSLFIAPLTIVMLYAFIVYFARKNTFLIVAGTLGLVLGLLPGWSETRYVLMPVVLILFDRVLRRGSWGRCVLLMAGVVLVSIVTPETTLLMLGILATLIVAELIHRSGREALAQSFARTIRCAIAGVGFVVAWVIFLVATHTFSGFLAYYQTTIAGHELWGAYSPQWSLTGDPWATVEFALPIALFLVTVVKVVVKLMRRSPWRPVEWAIVASSTPVLLFYQVVLDRMDAGHVNEVFQTLIPFVVLWALEILRFADSVVVEGASQLAKRWSLPSVRITVPVTVLSIVAIALWSPISISTWKDAPTSFHMVVPVPAPSSVPLGYTQPGVVDIDQITDLGKVLDRYAGKNAPVFDFTNEMGITYFLLNRVPGARFYHVESAQTAKAQNLEVNDLRKSQPPVVIFYDTSFGLPEYDGILSMERNYIVSQYILDHYRPLLDTHGQLVMLRNDLMNRAQPLPKLSTPPVTTDLYFDQNVASCDWGDVPNFLVHPTAGEIKDGTPFAVTGPAADKLISAYGWAFNTVDQEPVSQVLVVSNNQVISTLAVNQTRQDVAASLKTQAAVSSGFSGQFALLRSGPPIGSMRSMPMEASRHSHRSQTTRIDWQSPPRSQHPMGSSTP